MAKRGLRNSVEGIRRSQLASDRQAISSREFGELKAQVSGLVGSFEDFRTETRKMHVEFRGEVAEWRKELIVKVDDNLGKQAKKISRLERFRTVVVTTAGTVIGLAGAMWGALKIFGANNVKSPLN